MNNRRTDPTIQELFDAAAVLSGEQRRQYLDRHCSSDNVRREVEELLGFDHADDFLNTLADRPLGSEHSGKTEVSDDQWLPRRIGRYAILRRIGEGGMGIVFEARQENPERTVALKVIRSGHLSVSLRKRFEREAQVLGRLQHSGIAHVYDAGTGTVEDETGTGGEVPFFAMELIRGQPLGVHCSSSELSIRERLELFATICDSVEYAHGQGIVHRDLKPANILVTESGQSKILDFGVARLTNADVQLMTVQTEIGQLIGTVPYMSPEQVSGDSRLIDARSDVYALGVILYELLAGKLPYDLRHRPVPDAVRIIQEQDACRLATVASAYRGDLDVIAAKALEKDPIRRYQSAAQLAADIRRHLDDEPIVARPASTFYQLRKFSRRNKGLVIGAALTILTLTASTIVLAFMASKQSSLRLLAEERLKDTETARAQTERESQKTVAVLEFLSDTFAEARPNRGGRDTTIVQALDRAAEKISTSFDGQPQVEAEVRRVLGELYKRLGLYPQSKIMFNASRALLESSPDTSIDQLAIVDNGLARVHAGGGEYEIAESFARKAYEQYRKIHGEDNDITIEMHRTIATILLKTEQPEPTKQAELIVRDAMQRYQKLHGESDSRTLDTLHQLADVMRAQGKLAEAESILHRLLDSQRRELGDDHVALLPLLHNLASMARIAGRHDEAASLSEEAVRGYERHYGSDHPKTLIAMNTLAGNYYDQDKLDLATETYEKIMKTRRRVLGEDHPSTLKTVTALAEVAIKNGDFERGEKMHREVLAVQQAKLGLDHGDTLTTLHNLAWCLSDQKKHDEAAIYFQQAVEGATNTLPPNHWFTAALRLAYGSSLCQLKRFDEAESELLEAHRVLSSVLGDNHQRTRNAMKSLAELYEQTDRPTLAASWHSKMIGDNPPSVD